MVSTRRPHTAQDSARTLDTADKFKTLRPLERVEKSLPADAYFDPQHYLRELNAIWFADWLCVGRSDGLDRTGHYKVVQIGDQSIIVVRSTDGELKGFHNTCRHRGSLLCEASQGSFTQGRIVCPYHAWTYSLEGQLVHTPWRLESPDFDPAQFSLYEVGVGEWGGNLFVNLDQTSATSLSERLGGLPKLFENWNLEKSVSAYQYRKRVNCNWKVFWENFTECYHCPGIHPELCRIVPRFTSGIIRASDQPDWDPESGPDPETEPRLAPGMVTWSDDGSTQLPYYSGLSEQERSLGQTFGVFMPSCFIAAHVDFVRFAHILPVAEEQTEVVVECLFPAETVADETHDLTPTIQFIERLTDQDLRVCELNQRGLHSRRHQSGVLVAQEYYTHGFQNWVRERLGDQ